MAYQVDYNAYRTYQSDCGAKFNDTAQLQNQTALYDENSEYICDICKSHNFSGMVYHCSTCLNGDFDMCESCRAQGRNCFCVRSGNITPLRIIPGKGRKYGTIAGTGTNIDPEDLAGTTLSDLLPLNITLNDPLENPELLPYYQRFAAYTDTHRNPPYNTFLCTSTHEYETWENESYKPQRAFYEQKIADFNEIVNEARHFAQYNARSGIKGWEYQTPDGELVDTLDFVIHLAIKLEETYKDLSDLVDEMNKQWAAKEIYEAQRNGNHQHVSVCEGWFSKVAREEAVNYLRSKYERLTETLKDLEIAVKKAQALEKYACDIVIAKASAEVDVIKSKGQFQSTHEERTKATDTLKHHYDIRQKLEERLLRFRRVHINSYLAYRLSESPENEIAAKSECETSLNGATRIEEEAIRSISEEYDIRVTKSLLPAISSVSAMVPALPQYYSAPASQTSIQPPPLPPQDGSASTTFQTSNGSAPTSTTVSGNPPKFQMPLSYYSNMLTQQHVTTMNIINNIAGGNTTYSVINPITGLKYW
ncbi:hypothetical protein AOL_s00054g286 [Orbilia oligospora ATCC 24927]|uniref:ZZ-type domain-containing protein n=2 Tax=Orbilia oligospora TaxID=2813651 RepID=G1X5Z2_ARTOA|nr:hypothetical protein AOL_s00054g286 [Orbilia oligospora ATCC 24927]EGX51587.1 hypothetical protein AOL_s00054g286 [Orbilia oligospora ATCC 24927]KAF3274726.1 hypothetical protein TWF970_007709 [Orbilia oligospora]